MVVPYGADDDGRMMPAMMPTQCLLSLAGATDGKDCRMGEAGWRDRLTGPKHPLKKVRCRKHGIAFPLYPKGCVPYGRVPVLLAEKANKGESDGQSAEKAKKALEPKSGLLGAAIARSLDANWERALIMEESGPVLRTQQRWISWLGKAVGFDVEGEVNSEVLSELGLDAINVRGTLSERVAALSELATDSDGWLRLAGAFDLAGNLGGVWLMPDPRSSRVVSARGSLARAMRGPPR